MKKIIVPTDFSETAGRAQNFAIQSAKLFNSKITLLHSFEIEKFYSSDYIGYNKDFVIQMVTDIEKSLDRLRRQSLKEEQIEVQTYLSSYNLTNAINKLAEEKSSDMVVMGTLGESGLKEKLWGSRTSEVIGKTSTPVMVIPHEYEWKKPSKILFLTNRFERNDDILNYIFETSNLYMASVEVGVFTDIDDVKAEKLLENEQDINEYADYIKNEHYEKTIKAVHLKGEDFEDTLQKYVKENDIDMLVMVTYQGGFWKRLFNPSKTKHLSFHTDIPLLAIPFK